MTYSQASLFLFRNITLVMSKQAINNKTKSFNIYIQEIEKNNLMNAETAIELSERIKEGDQIALELLVKAHLFCVVNRAQQYQNLGLSLPDLINEGNLGLIKAAKGYDETRGYSFMGYANWFIRQAILIALGEKSRIVCLPLNIIDVINKLNKITPFLEQQHEREPNDTEIAGMLDLPLQGVIDAIKYRERQHITIDDFLRKEDEYIPIHFFN